MGEKTKISVRSNFEEEGAEICNQYKVKFRFAKMQILSDFNEEA